MDTPVESPQPSPTSALAKSRSLLATLANSSIYVSYERAFSCATGLPMALVGGTEWHHSLRGKRNENSFCALLARQNSACAACLRMQEALSKGAISGACTMTCHLGLAESAVPVYNGKEVFALLRTGQVLRERPSDNQLRVVEKKLRSFGIANPATLLAAYRKTAVIEPKRYDSAVQLLALFGQQLSAMTNELLIGQEHAEPPVVVRAKEYIHSHAADELSLGEVARAAHTSPSYFCRLFRKTTGLNYSQYLSRVRLERAKQLLLNPNLRVSEIAYEVGFQSLTHFNRIFKKLLGESPTEYRGHLRAAQVINDSDETRCRTRTPSPYRARDGMDIRAAALVHP
ncbi:MAG: helix-turn-helix domain-containing protein [Chthoniobacteraceae bacterium]